MKRSKHQPAALVKSAPADPPAVPLPEFLVDAPSVAPPKRGPSELARYLTMLRRHRSWLVAFAVAGAAVGAALTKVETPMYRSSATVEIHIANENYLNLRDVNPTAPATYYPEYDLQTQTRILTSRDLVARVAERLAKKPPEGFQPVDDRWSKFLGALHLGQARTIDWPTATGTAAGTFRVKALPNSRVLELTAESQTPLAAAAFLDGAAREFISMGLETRFRSNKQTGDWLNAQLADLKSKLTAGEANLLDYAKREGLLMTGGKDKENVADDRLLQLQRELSGAHADRVSKQARFESAATAAGGPLPETVESDLLRFHHEKLADLRRQLSDLSSSMKDTHPRVIKVRDQIKTLEGELELARRQVLERVKNEFESAVRREKLLLADYEAQTLVVRDQAGKATYYDLLKREVDTTRQLYDSLLQKVKEADVAAALRAPGSRIIDAADTPMAPFRPDWKRNTSMGLAVGLVLGLLVALAREQLKDTFHQPGDIELALRLPELGVVPAERDSTSKSLARLGRAIDERSLQPWSVETTLRHDRKSLLAESVRNTLTSILSASRSGRTQPRTIVVTSAGAGEGKTTLVCNLAMAFAEAGRRTVLIDADMRRPRIHGVFGISNERGLSTALSSAEPVEEVETAGTDVPGLFVVPSGPAEAAMGNLLHSPRLAELVAKLQEVFDVVLIDTPPVLLVADARIVGAMADGALLVVRAGDTSKEAAEAARRRLEDDGIPILGAVLNGWDPSGGTYYGYRSYGRYYSSTYGKA